MPTIPTIEPSFIVAGDTVQWTKIVPDYLATAGWTLKYSFQLIGSTSTPITFSASASGANYSVSELPATTTTWNPGDYLWTSFVDNGTARHVVGTGTLTIAPDPTAAFGDTHASRTLALIELAIEGRVPRGLEQTSIDGQLITRIPLTALMDLRLKYQGEVKAEQDKARVAAGLKTRRTMFARFTTPI